MQEMIITPEHERATKTIAGGYPCTLVTGKAGSGKTVLLKHLVKHFKAMKKNVAVVAPTGMAALQANGETINSFFKFRFGVMSAANVKVPREADVLKALNILFIDEASMLRCDMMDSIDSVLRRLKKSNVPFGGVQLVLIGDLYQIPPVVTNEDKALLEEIGYTSGFYFFNAKVFSKIALKTIELTKIFRVDGTAQSDIDFKEILNQMRLGENKAEVVEKFNKACFKAGRQAPEFSVMLGSTNAIVNAKNETELAKLTTKAYTYCSKYEGDFKVTGGNLPAPDKLVLKKDAVVMFTANDKDKQFVNGMIGRVISLYDSVVNVQLESGLTIAVSACEWKSYVYVVKGDKIEQEETGKYHQMPLTLGWAITIHKSQGKTIKNLHVDLGGGAFVSGQTYVAMSRAKSIEGITLHRPLRESDIICCPKVKDYFDPVFKLA